MNARFRTAIAACAASVLVSACGGHGMSPVPHLAQTARLDFTMHWPAVSLPSARKPHFISPSTKSVVVEVNGDASLTTIANNPSTGQPVTSSISVNAPPGNDTIAISLYDKADGNGNELGQAIVAQQIAAGRANTLSATIDGLVASVDLQPLPNQPAVATSTDASGATAYTITGGASITFTAAAKDADGNVILGPGDAITYSAVAVSDALTVSPVDGHPTEFTIGSGSARSSHPVGVIVHAVDGQGGNAQSNYSVALAPMLFVAYQNGGGTGQIAAMTMQGQPLPVSGGFPGVIKPLSIVFDEDDHRLYVLDGGSHQLLAFNADGTAAGGYTAPVIPDGVGVTYDAYNHELYVAGSGNGVSVYQTDGTPVPLAGTWDNNATPAGIAAYVTTDGFVQIFVANAGNNTLARYNEDGTDGPVTPLSRSPFYDTGFPPIAVAADADDGLTYVDGIDAGGAETLTAFPGIQGGFMSSITTGLSGAAGMLYDNADGLLFVANRTSGTLGIYDNYLGGLQGQVPAPAGLSTPVAIGIAY